MIMAEYPYLPDEQTVTLYAGDCLAALRTLPDASVHTVITDPPYGLSDVSGARLVTALTAWANGDREHVPDGKGFMGKAWDAFVPPPAVWDECLRVLKPGGHLAVFAGSRTVDLMGLSIRLAGFEMRDGIAAWLYGSGFPKGQDVGKVIDKAAGATREVVGSKLDRPGYHLSAHDSGGAAFGSGLSSSTTETRAKSAEITAPATDDARRWDGWNTALKPAHEPILLARKPLAGTVARNVVEHGTGAINVDACRVGLRDGESIASHHGTRNPRTAMGDGWHDSYQPGDAGKITQTAGRWPTNVVFAHHPDCGPDEAPVACVPGCQVAALDAQAPSAGGGTATRGGGGAVYGGGKGYAGTLAVTGQAIGYGDSGGASRFFPTFRYQAKAPKSERPKVDGVAHPTVKPLALMAWLVKLLCPPGGTVLDPFAGSGTTLQAARDHGASAIGCEAEPTYVPLIRQRMGDGLLVVETALPTEPEPEPVPIAEASCDVHGEHSGTVDCPECRSEIDEIVARVIDVAARFTTVPGVEPAHERALAAETVAEAQAARDDLRAALVAARGAA